MILLLLTSIAALTATILALVALSKALAAESSAKRAHERLDDMYESVVKKMVTGRELDANIARIYDAHDDAIKRLASALGVVWVEGDRGRWEKKGARER